MPLPVNWLPLILPVPENQVHGFLGRGRGNIAGQLGRKAFHRDDIGDFWHTWKGKKTFVKLWFSLKNSSIGQIFHWGSWIFHQGQGNWCWFSIWGTFSHLKKYPLKIVHEKEEVSKNSHDLSAEFDHRRSAGFSNGGSWLNLSHYFQSVTVFNLYLLQYKSEELPADFVGVCGLWLWLNAQKLLSRPKNQLSCRNNSHKNVEKISLKEKTEKGVFLKRVEGYIFQGFL